MWIPEVNLSVVREFPSLNLTVVRDFSSNAAYCYVNSDSWVALIKKNCKAIILKKWKNKLLKFINATHGILINLRICCIWREKVFVFKINRKITIVHTQNRVSTGKSRTTVKLTSGIDRKFRVQKSFVNCFFSGLPKFFEKHREN